MSAEVVEDNQRTGLAAWPSAVESLRDAPDWPADELEMTIASPHEVTGLLQAWRQGEQAALEKLVPLAHAELHRLAHRYRAGERAGHTAGPSHPPPCLALRR